MHPQPHQQQIQPEHQNKIEIAKIDTDNQFQQQHLISPPDPGPSPNLEDVPSAPEGSSNLSSETGPQTSPINGIIVSAIGALLVVCGFFGVFKFRQRLTKNIDMKTTKMDNLPGKSNNQKIYKNDSKDYLSSVNEEKKSFQKPEKGNETRSTITFNSIFSNIQIDLPDSFDNILHTNKQDARSKSIVGDDYGSSSTFLPSIDLNTTHKPDTAVTLSNPFDSTNEFQKTESKILNERVLNIAELANAYACKDQSKCDRKSLYDSRSTIFRDTIISSTSLDGCN